MTGWQGYLRHVEDVVDRAEHCLGTGDVDGAVVALGELVGRGPDEDLPPLPASEAARAERAARRLEAVHATAVALLGRMGPELVALSRLAAPVAAGPLFVDQTA